MAAGEPRSESGGGAALFWIVLAIILLIVLATCTGLVLLVSTLVVRTESQFNAVVAEMEKAVAEKEEQAQAWRLRRRSAWEEGEKKAQAFLDALGKSQWEEARRLGTEAFQQQYTAEQLKELVERHPFLRTPMKPAKHPVDDPSSAGPMEYRFRAAAASPDKEPPRCTVILRSPGQGPTDDVRIERVEPSND